MLPVPLSWIWNAHLIELLALYFPDKLHHNCLCEGAIHQGKGIVFIPARHDNFHHFWTPQITCECHSEAS